MFNFISIKISIVIAKHLKGFESDLKAKTFVGAEPDFGKKWPIFINPSTSEKYLWKLQFLT